LNWFAALLAEEMAPRPRRFRTSLRMATIATIGTGLMAAGHVDSALGPYTIWLLLGPVAMMSVSTATVYLAITGAILGASVPLAGILAESPWLMLPFIAVFTALSTYLVITRKLGSIGLLWQVVTLDSFYGVVFAPRSFGWADAALFGGCAIALGLISAFDTWIWPDPAEVILLESLAASVERIRGRLVRTAAYYLDQGAAERPPEPPATSEMPNQLALLSRAAAEGIGAHRRAVLLAAITRTERLHIRADRLVIAARENVPREVRAMLRPELEAACGAMAAALEEFAIEARSMARVGADLPPSPAAARVLPALEALDARIGAVRHLYIGRVGAAELSNFGAFTENLQAMARLVERPLDQPPARAQSAPVPPPSAAPQADPAPARYCWKVALCVVIGYVIGLASHRPEMSVILTTIIIAALPTYGAALRKMILRIVGAAAGGVISLLAIIVVTPNFESLPSYMLVSFAVLFISAYSSLSSGRVAYAGKQIGTTFLLVVAALSPARDIYSPLWRVWGVLLGTIVVTGVFFMMWPEYAGDSLLVRLRKVIRDALALMPGRVPVPGRAAIDALSDEITQVLSEILEVAEDARLEGRRSLIDHDAVVQSAGTIRRIAHRLATNAASRIAEPLPGLDALTEGARDAAYRAIRVRLESWLSFYESDRALSGDAARALAASHSRGEIAGPLQQFSSLVEEDQYARTASWTVEQRRRILEELQSLRRLEFLTLELDAFLSRIPGATPAPQFAPAAGVVARHPA
jgi:uncharacterized membrane protein YccC